MDRNLEMICQRSCSVFYRKIFLDIDNESDLLFESRSLTVVATAEQDLIVRGRRGCSTRVIALRTEDSIRTETSIGIDQIVTCATALARIFKDHCRTKNKRLAELYQGFEAHSLISSQRKR